MILFYLNHFKNERGENIPRISFQAILRWAGTKLASLASQLNRPEEVRESASRKSLRTIIRRGGLPKPLTKSQIKMIMLKLNYLTFIRSATDYCISILKPNLPNRIRLHVAECASPTLQDKGWHHCFISQILQFHTFRRFRDPTRGFVFCGFPLCRLLLSLICFEHLTGFLSFPVEAVCAQKRNKEWEAS